MPFGMPLWEPDPLSEVFLWHNSKFDKREGNVSHILARSNLHPYRDRSLDALRKENHDRREIQGAPPVRHPAANPLGLYS